MIGRKWTFEVGGKTKDELLLKLSENKISFNAYGILLFMSEHFLTNKKPKTVTVVALRVDELGFEAGAIYSDIIDAAISRGLQLCSLELAVSLRLHHLKQQDGNQITVASRAVFDDVNYPNGFYLRANCEELWLRGYRASDDWVWEADSLFAFVEPRA
ncbi:helicase [Vibrio vulnificus]|uniref:helicase n=1 Tax=Vibrio vulnificus TaxID=672 RepID=UPI001029273A|nr:helicase [Vibrio vulnificus]EII3056937.1 hypothetical protein [Vibrio vulnificus]EJU9788335.1 hypothetical protein [Vibrio vulnificus]MCA3993043.1 hypothetical protein [Vibrio vulnificus]MCU8404498.1 hypothetical protein [Vibrio vulnificus]RZQ92956.1 helicase [Vibrio vulnificus]